MHKGLILGEQQNVNVDTQHWKFGIYLNGVSIVEYVIIIVQKFYYRKVRDG